MRIIFDLRNVGLGNNGGSLTLIKCGNSLVDLGHDVFFVDSGRNQNTWCPLKANHILSKNLPKADVIIATGYKSVKSTVSAPNHCGKKFHYIRGWETWQGSEQWIVHNILNSNTIKIVNSLCLQNKLKKYGVDSKIIYPGYDFDEIYPMNIRNKNTKIVLGGLYTTGKLISVKRPDWIFETFRYIKKKYDNVELWMFGAPKQNPLATRYFSNPSNKEKNIFYNNIDIWLSTSQQEGLHLPPAEAMLTECPVVGTCAEMAGTQDYLVNGYTGLVTSNYLESFKLGVDALCKNKKVRITLGKNGRQQIKKIGSREENMTKFVKYLRAHV